MIRDLVPHHDDGLRQKLEKFDFSSPPTDPDQLARDLAETMIQHKGLGLAANQIGLPYRVFVMTGSPITAVFNPRIVDSSEEEIYMDEGCLSYPGLYVKVKRPAVVKVRYEMPNGETVTKTFEGLTARVFQHEYDHLEGEAFLQRANRIHLDAARKKSKTYYPAK